jgi:hypothetical protein
MKKLLFIAALAWFSTVSGPASAQNKGVKPLFSPPTFSAPQPFALPGYRFGRQNGAHTRPNTGGSINIWVTPDYDTHRRDLRDQKSWASPTPNPFANDPRNPMQQRAKPRGYIVNFN